MKLREEGRDNQTRWAIATPFVIEVHQKSAVSGSKAFSWCCLVSDWTQHSVLSLLLWSKVSRFVSVKRQEVVPVCPGQHACGKTRCCAGRCCASSLLWSHQVGLLMHPQPHLVLRCPSAISITASSCRPGCVVTLVSSSALAGQALKHSEIQFRQAHKVQLLVGRQSKHLECCGAGTGTVNLPGLGSIPSAGGWRLALAARLEHSRTEDLDFVWDLSFHPKGYCLKSSCDERYGGEEKRALKPMSVLGMAWACFTFLMRAEAGSALKLAHASHELASRVCSRFDPTFLSLACIFRLPPSFHPETLSFNAALKYNPSVESC